MINIDCVCRQKMNRVDSSDGSGSDRELDPFAKIRMVDSLHDFYDFDRNRDAIGSGAFSVVYRATMLRTKMVVALKVLPKKRMDSDKSVKDVAREVKILQSLAHDSMCSLVEALQTSEEVGIAMTLVDGCIDLGSYLKKVQRLPELHAAVVIVQLLRALDYLHAQKSLIHRDLKPENCCVSDLSSLMPRGVSPVLTAPSAVTSSSQAALGVGQAVAVTAAGKKACDSHGALPPETQHVVSLQSSSSPLIESFSPQLQPVVTWGRLTLVDFGFSRSVAVHSCSTGSTTPVPAATAKSDTVTSPSVSGASKSPTERTQKKLDASCGRVTEVGTDVASQATSNAPSSTPTLASDAGSVRHRGSKATAIPLSAPASPLAFVQNDVDDESSPMPPLPMPPALLAAGPASSPTGARRSRRDSVGEAPYSREQSLAAANTVDGPTSVFLSPCGSDRYLPLEMLNWLSRHGGEKFETTPDRAKKLDCYSVGIITHIMLSGNFPFNAKSRATLATQLAQCPPKMNSPAWHDVSEQAKEFIRGLLKQDVDERFTIKQALSHPWLAEQLALLPPSFRECIAKIGDMSAPSGAAATSAAFVAPATTATKSPPKSPKSPHSFPAVVVDSANPSSGGTMVANDGLSLMMAPRGSDDEDTNKMEKKNSS